MGVDHVEKTIGRAQCHPLWRSKRNRSAVAVLVAIGAAACERGHNVSRQVDRANPVVAVVGHVQFVIFRGQRDTVRIKKLSFGAGAVVGACCAAARERAPVTIRRVDLDDHVVYVVGHVEDRVVRG